MVEISTSILSIKENAIQKFYDLEVARTDYFHIDVMDGKFVKNDTSVIMKEYTNTIKQISNIPIDVHLMVKDVRKYVDEYLAYMPDRITFHYEALESIEEVKNIIQYIKENNVKVGISIKPDTKVEEIYDFLPYVHMVLVMTVEPGKGGQKLIPETLEKVRILRQYVTNNNIELDIEADGGIKLENIREVVSSGVDIAVVGSGITNTKNYTQTIKKLKNG